jgi:AraC-like DNA-binding protein
VPLSFFITVSFSYFYGPLLYFYFKSITKNYTFKIIDLLHLLPTLAIIVYAIPVYALSTEEKLSFMINNSYELPSFSVIFIGLTKFFSLAIYTYAIHKIYKKNKREASGRFFSLSLKWQYVLKNISTAYVVAYLLYGYAGLFMPYVTIARLPQILIMALSVLSIAFAAYIKPELFGSTPTGLNSFFKDKKYQKSGLTQNLSNELKEDLIQLFSEKKVYKENNISLEILSHRLNTTRHNTSQIINEHFNMNFFELINKFRIKEAAKIFEDDVQGSLNIIDVAYEVGYNNKVTFNKAFKKEMSVTPSEYIRSRSKLMVKKNRQGNIL